MSENKIVGSLILRTIDIDSTKTAPTTIVATVPTPNETDFGLISYVYSDDLKRAIRFAEGIDAGMVGINRGLVSDPAAPFGGMKQSGLGREGGFDGVHEFLQTKYIGVEI
jgi:acyl-CoA reductase-like NAD-dependent aldehyde dehydrogenase